MIRRTSLNLDLDLVAEARELLATKGTTDTIHRALDEIIRLEKRRRLAAWDLGGPTLEDLERMRRPRTFEPDA
jgi:Arc/MetJ family transcription regulator